MKIFNSKSTFTVLAFLLFTFFTQAQPTELPDKELPVDPKVTIGKLDNGFTYYIRENHKPEKRVELRLAVNAGSILEDDDQLGLAHFVEHMCFNGTKHFEKNELVEYLQSIGMRFGPEINAYTSFDETVYMLTIPSDSSHLVDQGFLVMEDWAHYVTMEDEEIDKERGVIIEEWRLGQGPWQRMRDEFLPVLLKDSHYADRLPIGKKEIIENCDYETLRRFYHDWYRPDLMALIVVGDIDAEIVEQKIIDHFSELSAPENSKERKEYDVPDQAGTLVNVSTDVEAPASVVRVFYKEDAKEFITYADYLELLRYSYFTGMLNRRLVELTEDEDPPFIGANFQYGSFAARSKSALQGYALVGERGIERGLEALLTENERVSRFGFTQGEFDRFKMDLLKRYQNIYNERDKTESNQLADEYIRNYLEDEPIPGIEFEYEFVKSNIDNITLEEINSLAQDLISDDNRVIIVNAPEKEDLSIPGEEEILAVAAAVSNMELEPYEDNISGTELMTEIPAPGEIVKLDILAELGALDLTLSNGARVILKPTDFKNDEVLFTAFSLGGHSVYPDSDHFTALNTDGIIKESGVSKFSNTDIKKILAGKTVYVAPSIGYETESIMGQTKTSDIESMLQLIYLNFTDPRVDEAAFNSYISKRKDLYQNLIKEPRNYFYDQYYRIRAQNHPRGDYIPKPEDWDGIDYNRAIEIYKDRFSDAGNFTFLFVGAFSIDSIKPMIEQYIASLPTIDREETYVDLGIRPPAAMEIHNVYKGNDPKSMAIIYFEQEAPWNKRDAFFVKELGEILGFIYIEKLREEMSGVYTVRANSSLDKIPYEHSSLQILIPCSPENVDSLVDVAIGELITIQKSGVEEKEIIKARETRRRQLETNSETNNFWLNAIQSTILTDGNLDSVTDEELIEQITSKEIQRVANEYFNSGKYLLVVLYPEEYKETTSKED
jgi:zinc protease